VGTTTNEITQESKERKTPTWKKNLSYSPSSWKGGEKAPNPGGKDSLLPIYKKKRKEKRSRVPNKEKSVPAFAEKRKEEKTTSTSLPALLGKERIDLLSPQQTRK